MSYGGKDGITFMGDDRGDVSINESSAEARNAKVGSDGPIESSVPGNSTMSTSDLQTYPQPTESGSATIESPMDK